MPIIRCQMKLFKRGRKTRDPIPAYFRLQRFLQEAIETGQWAPGEKVPPEKRLAEIHKVSVGTVTKAVLNLVNEGYLYRIQGSGTFVAGSTLRLGNIRYYCFLKEFGDHEEDLRIKFLERRTLPGIKSVNRRLKIAPSQGLFQIKRVLYSGEKPAVYSTSYFPRKIFTGLEKYSASWFEKTPIYLAIEEAYGLPTILNRELLSAVRAEPEMAEVLNLPCGEPVLLIEMLAFTYKERPYEYRQSYCRTDGKKIIREY
jgi:GntR family transcriptional regulator